MHYVFGPIPSRRLKKSLGVDPVPFKTCDWNCVYCQLGQTSPLTKERRDYVPPDMILAEVASVLQSHNPGEIDWVTFAGSGEPTLHASLGKMIRGVQTMTALPVCVITNGSLLYLPEVRQDLLAADAVMPTVCAGTEQLYRRIHRPMPELAFDRFIDGLATFRDEYHGKFWVEVVLVQGLNDSEEALQDLAVIMQKIRPDEVHIHSPTRPPCEPWVKPVEIHVLDLAQQILGKEAQVVGSAAGEFNLSGFENVVDAIVAILRRHPVAEDELMRMLGRWQPDHVLESLADLKRSGQAQVVTRDDHRYWSYAAACYVEDAKICGQGTSEDGFKIPPLEN